MVMFSDRLLSLLTFCPLVQVTVSRDVRAHPHSRPAGSAPCTWEVPVAHCARAPRRRARVGLSTLQPPVFLL